ncbi:MAG: dihydroneopterin aldolase [Bacteroidetes bacterium]|jgi:dihydroneopterin aldolase|nr:dihydroneopterin aldolase [Bacteroidota bacterium]
MKQGIAIKGLRFFAHHGLYEHEKKNGQWFTLNLSAELDVAEAAYLEDRVEGTTDYGRIVHSILDEMKTPSQLLEHAVARLQGRLKSEYPELKNVSLTLAKQNPSIGGYVAEFEVSVFW